MGADIALVYNPNAASGKSRKSFELAISTLEKLGVNFTRCETRFPGHAIDLAEQMARDGFDVVGCGGDGTCNEVLNGVIRSGTKQLVGFIPMGSGNDIPGALGIRPDVKRACEIIAERYTDTCDIGVARGKSNEPRYFLGIGSQGFDAEVTHRVNSKEKTREGTGNYSAMAFKTVFSFKIRRVRVKLDGDTFEGRCNLVAVGNGPSYGGFMYMCAGATVKDGVFHVVAIENLGKLKLLTNFMKMYKKTHLSIREAKQFDSKHVEVEMVDPDDEPYLYQVDGEVLGPVPVKYDVIPDGFEFIVPEEDEVCKEFEQKYKRLIEKGKIPRYPPSR